MARPTEIPDFATGASRRLEPEAGEKSNGFREGYRFAPRKANWVVGLAAAWARYLSEIIDSAHEHVYPVAKTRTLLVSIFDALQYPRGAAADDFSLAGDVLTGHYFESNASQAQIVVPLQAYIREGQVLSSFRLLCNPVGSEAATGDRIAISVCSILPSFGTPAAPSVTIHETAFDSGTAGIQSILLSMSPEVTVVHDGSDVAREYFVVITSSVAVSGDRIYALQATITDPGPRNV